MVRKKTPALHAPLVLPRADPEALAKFDPATKICTMNCGPHLSDMRSKKERMFLCDDCWTVPTKDGHGS